MIRFLVKNLTHLIFYRVCMRNRSLKCSECLFVCKCSASKPLVSPCSFTFWDWSNFFMYKFIFVNMRLQLSVTVVRRNCLLVRVRIDGCSCVRERGIACPHPRPAAHFLPVAYHFRPRRCQCYSRWLLLYWPGECGMEVRIDQRLWKSY